MPIADDYAAELSRWDITGDLQLYARAIGQMFAEVEGYAEDIDGTEVIVPTYVQLVQSDRPLAYWRLGDTAGTVATDSVGSHAGTYNTALVLGQQSAIGAENSASTFFPGDAFNPCGVDIPYDAALATPHFSVELWVKPTTAGEDAVLFNADNGTPNKGFEMRLISVNELQINCYGTSNDNATAVASVTFADWNHIVATYDGTHIIAYVNGVQVATSGTYTGYTPSDGAGGALGHFAIGDWDGPPCLIGYMQEVALYDYALPVASIAAHYAARDVVRQLQFVGSRVGWQPLWDYTIAPHEALVWLCMVAGETAPQGATDDQLRSLIQASPNSRRGSPDAIAAAIKQCLTGGQRVGLKERWRSDTAAADNDSLSIYTYLAETPDQNQVQAAIRRTVPADINVYYTALTGPTWDAVQAAAGGGTWSNLYAHYSAGSWAVIEGSLLALPGYVIY